MSYPFLPVNSCCTDVVLNNPCGCPSTTHNTGCGQNQCGTNKTLSSTIVYNGPVLDCIIAEPCDTLNVILQKIDEIICNLLAQINTLNIQVANITTQVININNQITTINNTLDVCCNVTTTTTTTAIPTTTTTSSSTSSTTTSTTTSALTYCYTVEITGNSCITCWLTAEGVEECRDLPDEDTTFYVCAQKDSVISTCTGTGSSIITGGVDICTTFSQCIPTTTTTTTI